MVVVATSAPVSHGLPYALTAAITARSIGACAPRIAAGVVVVLFVPPALLAQSAFEVASVKRNTTDHRGGPPAGGKLTAYRWRSYTAMLATVFPCASTPVVVDVRVLPSGETTVSVVDVRTPFSFATIT